MEIILNKDYTKHRVFISSSDAVSQVSTSDFTIELPDAVKNVAYVNWAYCNIGDVLVSIDEINNNKTVKHASYWRYIPDINGLTSNRASKVVISQGGNYNARAAFLPDQLREPTNLQRLRVRLLEPDGNTVVQLATGVKLHLDMEMWSLKD